MKKSNQHNFYGFKRIGYKPLSICLLILLVAISSCAVRKSLQYLVSGETPPTSLTVKAGKSGLAARPVLKALSNSCEQMEEAKNSYLSAFDVHSSGTSNVFLYFTLIPAFLISVFSFYKDHRQLPVPFALFNWPQFPLFLQNRLLLI